MSNDEYRISNVEVTTEDPASPNDGYAGAGGRE